MKFIKRLFGVFFLVIIIMISLKVNEGYNLYKDALATISLEKKIEEIKSIDNYTSIKEVPEIYLKALVAVEDHRFYIHNGIDVISIVRALINDIMTMSLAEGGSTITQQLAKNSYFTQEKKITRKIAEVFMAFEFEKNYSKEDILEFYINTSYYGEGCYTLREASKRYFDKEPTEMNEYESILLAGVPNAPSVYAPTVNPELAKERQLQVIRKMIQHKVITEEEAKAIIEMDNSGDEY